MASENDKPKPDAAPGTGADVLRSMVTLAVGLAWPATVLVLVFVFAARADGIARFLNGFMEGREQLKLSVGPTSGISFEVKQQVVSGLTQQLATAKVPAPPSELERAAASAVSKLATPPAAHAKVTTNVLWVDDHPENNVGLQFAFQSLGMTVICIGGNDGIAAAFRAAGSFDVVITDMHRDAVGEVQPENATAGLETVKIIQARHPPVPVIIYAGLWTHLHGDKPPVAPVIAVTNDPTRVLDLVTDIAQRKRPSAKL